MECQISRVQNEQFIILLPVQQQSVPEEFVVLLKEVPDAEGADAEKNEHKTDCNDERDEVR